MFIQNAANNSVRYSGERYSTVGHKIGYRLRALLRMDLAA